jgi:hypothetical protein
MKKIGSFLLTIGLLAIVLNFVNMVPSVLFWIYTWGDSVAWIIMAAVVILGGALFVFGKKEDAEEA